MHAPLLLHWLMSLSSWDSAILYAVWVYIETLLRIWGPGAGVMQRGATRAGRSGHDAAATLGAENSGRATLNATSDAPRKTAGDYTGTASALCWTSASLERGTAGTVTAVGESDGWIASASVAHTRKHPPSTGAHGR